MQCGAQAPPDNVMVMLFVSTSISKTQSALPGRIARFQAQNGTCSAHGIRALLLKPSKDTVLKLVICPPIRRFSIRKNCQCSAASAAPASTTPQPVLASQPGAPTSREDFMSAALTCAQASGLIDGFERSAATTPATTGQAAEVPESAGYTPEPTKWLKPAKSGF